MRRLAGVTAIAAIATLVLQGTTGVEALQMPASKASNDGQYQATVAAPVCNFEVDAAQFLSQVEFTVALGQVTMVIPGRAGTIPPAFLAANGTFNITIDDGFVVTGRFRDGNVEGQFDMGGDLLNGQVVGNRSCTQAFTGQLVADSREDSGARFSDFSGQVEYWCPPEGPEAMRIAKLETVLYVDCHIITAENSSVMLSFADMTTFVMKPESEIILSSPAAKESQVKLMAGNLWVNVKKMLKDGSMEIEMSQAVAGIKGTIFVVQEGDGTSTLKVFKGTVAFASTATGRTKKVGAGETVTADADGLRKVKRFDVGAEKASWKALPVRAGGKAKP